MEENMGDWFAPWMGFGWKQLHAGGGKQGEWCSTGHGSAVR
jgi:hypothetical protein